MRVLASRSSSSEDASEGGELGRGWAETDAGGGGCGGGGDMDGVLLRDGGCDSGVVVVVGLACERRTRGGGVMVVEEEAGLDVEVGAEVGVLCFSELVLGGW